MSLPCLKGISERFEKSHTPPFSVWIWGKRIAHRWWEINESKWNVFSTDSHKRSSMKMYSLPLWLHMTLKSIKFPRVVGCALISGNQQTFLRPLHRRNASVHSQKHALPEAELLLIDCMLYKNCQIRTLHVENCSAADVKDWKITVNHCHYWSTHSALLAELSYLKDCRK